MCENPERFGALTHAERPRPVPDAIHCFTWEAKGSSEPARTTILAPTLLLELVELSARTGRRLEAPQIAPANAANSAEIFPSDERNDNLKGTLGNRANRANIRSHHLPIPEAPTDCSLDGLDDDRPHTELRETISTENRKVKFTNIGRRPSTNSKLCALSVITDAERNLHPPYNRLGTVILRARCSHYKHTMNLAIGKSGIHSPHGLLELSDTWFRLSHRYAIVLVAFHPLSSSKRPSSALVPQGKHPPNSNLLSVASASALILTKRLTLLTVRRAESSEADLPLLGFFSPPSRLRSGGPAPELIFTLDLHFAK
ncbi:hypothetical protein EVG20_g4318 [Dentipellis fragilis]|uniref:Uncharacterized protein n=1 Tax=Dentipellis fragilis TaxID=205917 RepID=A0A4Y9YYE4_9AGAM|nr:hypothetical protein EVG20_g4318 [Dentipellis fragilis]